MRFSVIKPFIITLLPMTALSAAAADYYTNDFNSISAALTLKDGDGSTLSEYHYKSLDLNKAWVVGQVGTHGFAALSLSHTGDDTAQDNWLISPAVSVNSAEACVYWQARSLDPDFLESYRVMVSTDNGETFTELFSTSAENSVWISRIISLADYVGKDVRIAFVCNSVNKFILAIDKLRIGVPQEGEYYVENHTPHFVGNQSEANISATITNVGKSLSSAKALLYNADGIIDSVDIEGGFASAQTIDVNFTLPLTLNEAVDYTICIEDNDGTIITAATDRIFSSYFKRKILVDKATGTWCNNCPTGEVIMQHLEEKYGDEIIPVTTHTGDIMTQGDYFSGLDFSAIPTFMINRNRETCSSSNAYFDTEALTPTIASISLSATSIDSKSIRLHCDTRFAENIDNSADNYRIAYTFTRDYHDATAVGNVQSNSSLSSSAEQYYFMPSYIQPDMMYFRNVTIDGSYAFTGLASSLPTDIEADTDYAYETTITLPSKIESLDNARLIAYILDNVSGYVYNAECIDLAALSGINDVIADKTSNTSFKLNGRNALINFANPTGNYSLTVYALDGRVVYNQSGKVSSSVAVNLDNLNSGMFIVNISQNSAKTAYKISLQ